MEWEQVWAILGVNAALFILSIGTTITLWLWARSESRADIRMMLGMVDSIKDEMKDFHGRLERQDAEFKSRMEKQDAEFKSHMMRFHTGKK